MCIIPKQSHSDSATSAGQHRHGKLEKFTKMQYTYVHKKTNMIKTKEREKNVK